MSSAYKMTGVYWGKTQTQIMQMLEPVGITQTRFTSLEDRFILEFMARANEKQIPRAVRILVPLSTRPGEAPERRNKELNIIHRILLNHFKAKFVAIENGLIEFESEFMAHLVITDKSGRTSTMDEALLPQYQQNLEDKTTPKFLLGDGN